MNTILRVNDLVTTFRYGKKDIPVVNGVSFEVHEGEILGIVGESGCGKSVTSLSIMRLINPPGKIAQGEILLGDTDLTKVPANKLHRLRGKDIAMIFQEPMTSLNPLQTIGRQIAEAVLLHSDVTKQQAWEKAVEMLGMVGIASPEKRAKAYPHMLSGGMRQRVMIAMALSMNPHLLIADEPTTALDVTVQAQILELIKKLRDEIGMAIMLITHDLGVISETCERVIVMYAGEIVESGETAHIFDETAHPYTEALFDSIPSLNTKTARLSPIPGLMPDPTELPGGCVFHPRCTKRMEKCDKEVPEAYEVSPGHTVKCHLYCGGKRPEHRERR